MSKSEAQNLTATLNQQHRAKNLIGFGLTIGLMPFSCLLGSMMLDVSVLYIYPELGLKVVYWLLTGAHFVPIIVGILWVLVLYFALVWVANKVSRKFSWRVSGRYLFVLLQFVSALTSYGIVLSMSFTNYHLGETQLNGTLYRLSEWKGRNAGFLTVWKCDEQGLICESWRSVTLEDYGLYRSEVNQLALVASPNSNELVVIVDDRVVSALKP